MIFVVFEETPSEWIGSVFGEVEGPASIEQKRSVIRNIFAEAVRNKKSFLRAIQDRQAATKRLARTNLVERLSKRPPMFWYRMPREPKQTPIKFHPRNLVQATKEIIKDAFPNSSRPIEANSFKDFQKQFLERVQGLILDYATWLGVVLIPANFVKEICTPQQIIALAARLKKRASKTPEMLALKLYLLTRWETDDLCKLDRNELAEEVNRMLSTDYSPESVWKTAYRSLGLLSDRKSGPKPRM